MIHVQRVYGANDMFCSLWIDSDSDIDYVNQHDWVREPELIQQATCPQCLLRIFMLGDSATIALARMGMKIEARNAEEAS